MSSPFNPQNQVKDLDARITVALERISSAFRAMLWEAGKKYKLSPIQVQVLIFLRYHGKGQCTITCLSEEFSMSKPTISEVVKTLGQKAFIQKVPSQSDTRSFTIQLTQKGKELAQSLGGFSDQLTKQLKQATEKEKESLYQILLTTMTGLKKEKVLKRQRMCPSCEHLAPAKNNSRCLKLSFDLTPATYLLDCCEHAERKSV